MVHSQQRSMIDPCNIKVLGSSIWNIVFLLGKQEIFHLYLERHSIWHKASTKLSKTAVYFKIDFAQISSDVANVCEKFLKEFES